MALLNFTSFTMKMGAADSSKTPIIIYQIIRRRILEYSTISLVITAKKKKSKLSGFSMPTVKDVANNNLCVITSNAPTKIMAADTNCQ